MFSVDVHRLAALRKKYPLPWPIREIETESGLHYQLALGPGSQHVLTVSRETAEFLELCGKLAAVLEVRKIGPPVDNLEVPTQE